MPNLWSAIGRPDLAEDARFDTNPNRLTNRQALTDIIESWMATFETDAEVMSALEGARVPYGPSLSPTDALTHPHFVERGLVRTVSDPLAGNVQIPGFPFKSTVPLPPDDHVAPALGEHNRDVLIGMAGLSEARRLVAPEPMACGCVADSPSKDRQHRFNHSWIKRRRPVVVEIDLFHDHFILCVHLSGPEALLLYK